MKNSQAGYVIMQWELVRISPKSENKKEKNGEREVEEEDERNMEMIPLGAATA